MKRVRLKRVLVYLWAAPATLLGIVFVPLALISGGEIRLVAGVLEVSGGFVSLFLTRGMLGIDSAAALTLGHVILGQDKRCLELNRKHELVHVRQYERLGPFMIPLYLWSSIAARLSGGDVYADNCFEREAFEHDK